jgi:hypothetical protein
VAEPRHLRTPLALAPSPPLADMTSSQQLIHRFEPITLAEMDAVKLQARMDTKYVFAESELPVLLERLMLDYRLLEVEQQRGTVYRTLYFDTAHLKHFLDHHNGRVFRSKVRFREYVGSPLCYLEVKRKTGRGATDKARLRVDAIPGQMSAEQFAFASEASGSKEPLLPVLWNQFTRLTLVHRTRHERLTIDQDLRFATASGDRELNGVCIAELKEERADRGSPFASLMKQRGIRPNGLSKYCTGMLLLGLAPKHNSFKATMLRVSRLQSAA